YTLLTRKSHHSAEQAAELAEREAAAKGDPKPAEV
ncbi:MAG: hypothetical protein H6R48_1011, partial [Proteobacteria bacterium]|nr:hypothetical protein [Pseudomonadota bacterium]